MITHTSSTPPAPPGNSPASPPASPCRVSFRKLVVSRNTRLGLVTGILSLINAPRGTRLHSFSVDKLFLVTARPRFGIGGLNSWQHFLSGCFKPCPDAGRGPSGCGERCNRVVRCAPLVAQRATGVARLATPLARSATPVAHRATTGAHHATPGSPDRLRAAPRPWHTAPRSWHAAPHPIHGAPHPFHGAPHPFCAAPRPLPSCQSSRLQRPDTQQNQSQIK